MLKAHKNICEAMLLEHHCINSGLKLLEQGGTIDHHVLSLVDLPVVLEEFFKMVFKVPRFIFFKLCVSFLGIMPHFFFFKSWLMTCYCCIPRLE